MRFTANSFKGPAAFRGVLLNVEDAEVRSAVARLELGEVQGQQALEFARLLNRKCLENKLPCESMITTENAPAVAAALANRLADHFESANV